MYVKQAVSTSKGETPRTKHGQHFPFLKVKGDMGKTNNRYSSSLKQSPRSEGSKVCSFQRNEWPTRCFFLRNECSMLCSFKLTTWSTRNRSDAGRRGTALTRDAAWPPGSGATQTWDAAGSLRRGKTPKRNRSDAGRRGAAPTRGVEPSKSKITIVRTRRGGMRTTTWSYSIMIV